MPAYRVQKKSATQGAASRSRLGFRAAVRAEVGTVTAPIIITDENSDDEPGQRTPIVEINVALSGQIPQTITPAPTRGGTLRFRGLALAMIGWLYPNARFEIHRIGCPKDYDISTKGINLEEMDVLIDKVAIYRVTMAECDVPTDSQVPLVWSKKHVTPGYLDFEEYRNILKLGEPGVGKFSLFTYFDSQKEASWALIRQTPDREYTFENCLNLLGVPDEFRGQIKGFGPTRWEVGDRTPHLYICKDLTVKTIGMKIKNIMLSNHTVQM